MEKTSVEQIIFSKTFLDWDASEILSLVRRLNKQETQLQSAHPELYPLKIAVLGTCNTQYLTLVLKPFLYALGIRPQFYEGVYNSLVSEVLNPDSDLYRFQPEVLIAARQYRDIENFPPLLAGPEAVHAAVQKQAAAQMDFWRFFHERCPAQVFLTNYAVPNRHVLGNLEANLPSGQNHFIRLLNAHWLERKPAYVSMLDQEAISADFGKNRWFDDSAWFLSKQPFALEALPVFAHAVARQLATLAGAVKKCLVVDLDNTLWGGIIGDDGIEGINLDPNNAVGEAYLDFQRTLRRYRERGVLLAVCSKNERIIAEKVFREHPFCLLKLEDFSAFIANWEEKPENLRQIARQLNIGLDSLVFFDDNPAERELVRSVLPMVTVVPVPEDPADYSVTLDQGGYFDWLQLSAEDLSRAGSYAAERQREELSTAAVSYEDYLRALEMTAEIGPVLPGEFARFTQLINKTNQFNLRTVRYSEPEVERLAQDPGAVLLKATLQDKFSNYGLISALILRRAGQELFLDTWVMSCRVFKRGLEKALMNRIVELATESGCATITGEYIPTAKNGFVADLLDELGFSLVSNAEGIRRYSLQTAGYVPHETKIRVEQQ